jgi:uncharacterized integral membrane protein (TIGR00698 family)
MNKINQLTPGILLCFAVAAPAWFLGKSYPLIGAPVFGILFGMALAKISPNFEHGIKFTSKKILQYSIILLGFGMNLFNVLKVGSQSLFVMLFTLSAAFLTAYFVGKTMKLDGEMTILIGVGTSICGGSAIAATAPVIQAKDKDVAHAISTIFLFNIIAVFIFPTLGHMLRMTDTGFGMWAGTAINDTSSVVAAATAWSIAAGNNTALAFATIVKLTRTLMIVPITLALAVYTAKKSRIESSTSAFNFSKIFPWFVLWFVLASIMNTFAGIPVPVSGALTETGKFMITMAMVAIGLNTNVLHLIKNGLKPILLGLYCWFAVAAVSIAVQAFMNIW